MNKLDCVQERINDFERKVKTTGNIDISLHGENKQIGDFGTYSSWLVYA